jgi:hypothetical protein
MEAKQLFLQADGKTRHRSRSVERLRLDYPRTRGMKSRVHCCHVFCARTLRLDHLPARYPPPVEDWGRGVSVSQFVLVANGQTEQ